MEVKKVHEHLKEVEPNTVYRLGVFEIEFQDGPIQFQLDAAVCNEKDCPCDNIQIDWVSPQSRMTTWYTAEKQWLDPHYHALPEEITSAFAIVEKTEEFQKRYSHLVYLRRKQVLARFERRQSPFQYRTHLNLLLEDSDPAEGHFGKAPFIKGGPALYVTMSPCQDPECYCCQVFVNLYPKPPNTMSPKDEEHVLEYRVDERDHWEGVSQTKRTKNMLRHVKTRFQKEEPFLSLLGAFRRERMFHNYNRFVGQYEKANLIL